MQSLKRILILFSGSSLIIAGLLGVALVFEFSTLLETRELFIRLVMVFGILSVVSGGLVLLSRLNKE